MFFFSVTVAVTVKPWLKQVQFDAQNGMCHIQLRSAGAETKVHENVAWLQNSQDHVATRLLSFLIRWVSCKDHAPRLDDVQALLAQLRQMPPLSLIPVHPSAEGYTELDPEPKDDSDRSTVYRRKKQRASKHAPQQTPVRLAGQVAVLHRDFPVSTRPLTIAGVLFSPPRRTKGLRDRWTISRQPMSYAEQLSTSLILPVRPPEDGSVCDEESTDRDQTKCASVLWDQRFFIEVAALPSSVTAKQSCYRIRPLELADVQGLRKQFSNQAEHQKRQGLKELETWLETVPGNAKYTIPVVCLQDASGSGPTVEKILSIPSVGLHLHPSPIAVASRFRSNSHDLERDTEATNAMTE